MQFSNTKTKSRIDEQTYGPYLAARRDWDERYGDLITRARNWRFMAVLCALSSLVATAGVVYMAGRSRLVPFVVAIDSLGRSIASGSAEQATAADDRLRRATILSWVEDLRTVSTDALAQRKAIDSVYAHIAGGSQAQTFVSEFYRGNPPQKRAQNETVSVEINSVLPSSDRTLEVEWMETTRDLFGAVKTQQRWKGAFTLAVTPPTEERAARINPLGLYVTNASWTRVL
jgi:type IV secretion system protein VirB5